MLCWPFLGWIGSATAALAFLVGGLLLSPDLDTHSRPTRRWGPLRLLWWPYRKLLRHRSLLSHGPFLGTLGRLGYLGGLVLVLAGLLTPWGAPSPVALLHGGQQVWNRHPDLLLLALVGLEASAWLHLIQDGDPVARPPRVLRLLRRRRRQRAGRGRQPGRPGRRP
ncbi:MAG: hypothetical protein CK536_05240 [Synechococcus sp. Baikal-G1]|nr:MAG: hypothetical protein CK536_05240 [Synechococcus sp. Baikal-G1]